MRLPYQDMSVIADGTIQGIRARGNTSVSIAWKGGKLTTARVTGAPNKEVVLRYGEKQKAFRLPASGTLQVSATDLR